MANSSNKKQQVELETKKQPINSKLSQLSADQPIPFEGGRGFSYVTERRYLPFLDPDDNYAKLLLQSRLLSCTHNACVTTKKDYCAGNGFQTVDEKEVPDKKFTEWFTSVNVKDESGNEINRKIFDSFLTFGNTPIEIVRFTVAGKRHFFVYVHNFLEWRLCEPDTDGIVHGAIYSRLFLKDGIFIGDDDLKNSRVIPIYNPRNKDKKSSVYRDGINWLVDSKGAERTLIWYKHSTAGFDYYGLPSSVSTLIYQILEYKGGRFNLDNFENNMVVSAILALKGSISQPELDKIGKKALNVHTGDGKRGRVMVVGSEEGIDGSDFHPFDTHKEGSYKESDEHWSQKIILGNQWDAILAGIIAASTMGKGVGFLTKIIEVKKNTVIKPAQQDLMDKVWSTIIKIGVEWMNFKIDPAVLQIRNTIDISGLTDVDITPAVTVDEVREAKGMPAAADKKKGKMFLGELGANQKKGVYVKQNTKDDVQSE